MSALRICLFGAPLVEMDGRRVEVKPRKALALLVYLACTEREQRRDTLATLFWPEFGQSQARAALRRHLSMLGQYLGGVWLETDREIVALISSPELWIDVVEFQARLAACGEHRHEATEVCQACREPLEAASSLYQDSFLAGFSLQDCPDFDDWQSFLGEALHSALAGALQRLLTLYGRIGEYEHAISYAQRWLALDSLHEPAHRALMQLYAQTDHRAAAMRQYRICVDTLEEGLGVPPAEETTELFEAIRSRRFPEPADGQQVAGLEKTVATVDAAVIRPSNLPAQPTPFVGREQELANILDRLQDPDCRLLTLVGPGGMGKTRLAIESAQRLLDMLPDHDDFAQGIFFVPLQPVDATNGVVSAIADATDFQFYSNAPPREQLIDYLRQKRLLLVLDNFEHLLSSAELVSDVLARAPGVKILLTSREALKLREEWFHPIAGMRFSDDKKDGRQSAPDYDAVRLFQQTARRAQPNFSLDTEQEHVLRICRLVDGIPLGIELAAAWLNVLPSVQIAGELERGLEILTARHRGVPARHRSMGVLLEQSWQHLSEREQKILARLSIFHGGCDQRAAEAVAGASLYHLASLVEKSLLQATEIGRYQMHELLRQFSQEQLEQDSENLESTHDRHSRYYLNWVVAQHERFAGESQRAALDAISVELDNISAAWRWAVQRGDYDVLDLALHALYLYCNLRGRFADGLALLTGMADALHNAVNVDGDSVQNRRHQLGRVLARLGRLQSQIDDHDALGNLRNALTYANAPEDRTFALTWLGSCELKAGDRAAGITKLEKSIAISRQTDDQHNLFYALQELKNALWHSDFVEARHTCREMLAISRRLNRPDLTAKALVELASMESFVGGYDAATEHLHESLSICESVRYRNLLCWVLDMIAWNSWSQGSDYYSAALAYYDRALVISDDLGRRSYCAIIMADKSLVLHDAGQSQQALELVQQAVKLARQTANPDAIGLTLSHYGSALTGNGEHGAAWPILLEALEMLYTNGHFNMVLWTLSYIAALMVAENEALGRPLEAAQRQKVRDLLFCVSHHPVTPHVFRDRAMRLQATLPLQTKGTGTDDTRIEHVALSLDEAVVMVLGEHRLSN